jgi:ureidoacrylate peracid hydrolase
MEIDVQRSDALLNEAATLFAGLPDVEIVPEKTALISIDMAWVQKPGYGLSVGVKSAGLDRIYDYYCAEMTAVVPKVRALQDICRAAGIEVIHIHVSPLDERGRDRCPVMKAVDGYVAAAGAAIEGEEYSGFLEGVGPRDDEIVISKSTPGVFPSSSLDQTLRTLGKDTLIVVGLVTNACVESSVRQAGDRGYNVFLVTDACSTWTEKGQTEGLRVMGRWFARLTTTNTMIKRIREVSPALPEGLVESTPEPTTRDRDDYFYEAYDDLVTFFRGMPPFEPLPHRSALVILDMQYLMAHRDYGLGRIMKEAGADDLYDYYFGEVDRLIPRIQRLAEVCRGAGITVLHSHIAAGTEDSRDLLPQLRHYGLTAPRGSQETQILEQIAPVRGDLVAPRKSLSLFTSPVADQSLRNMHIDTLYFAGVMTNVSIETSARDAAGLGYKVAVVRDACAALTPADHQQGLEILEWVWTTTAQTEDLLDQIRMAHWATQTYG